MYKVFESVDYAVELHSTALGAGWFVFGQILFSMKEYSLVLKIITLNTMITAKNMVKTAREIVSFKSINEDAVNASMIRKATV